jgi:glutathione S-transferase
MKLYINPLTVNNIKVLLLCNALEIEPEFQVIALNKGEQRSDKFLAINPEGKVPVLQEGELLLNESNAILQYIAAKHQSTLWPSNLTEQAKVLRVLFWQSNYFNSGVGPLAHRKVVMPYLGFATQEVDVEQMTKFYKAISTLECFLKENKFVATEIISIADISLAAFFIFVDKAAMPLEHYPNTQIWLRNISKQTWFSKTQFYLETIISNSIFN